MEEKRWESCNAEALLEEFFSQDDLRQLALSTGELLGCPLLVLDDTFHIAAHMRQRFLLLWDRILVHVSQQSCLL